MLIPFLFFLLHLVTFRSSAIGINYGQVADNLPNPSSVLPLLRSLNATRVKLYDTDPKVLSSFSSSDIQFTVGLPDRLLPKIASSPSFALQWVSSNLKPFLPGTRVSALTVGNEVLSGNDTLSIQSLLPAMQSIQNVLASLGYGKKVLVTTPHSLNVLGTSYPPSAGCFRDDLLPFVKPLLGFLNRTGAPFLINAYPFFAYKADPKRISLDYVLFEKNEGVVDPRSGLRYDNMLHAQVDAVRSAILKAGGGKGIEVRVSETGWPSRGDEDEIGASPENARKYNGNLMKMVEEGRGTPMSPGTPLEVYVFALFNENLKPGPVSERHYGLFNPDGSPAYDLGIGTKSGSSSGNFSAGSGGGGGGSIPPSSNETDDTSSVGYYTISAARERLLEIVMVAVATLVGVVLVAA